jgi:DNA-directed RNA polymerase I subunit RPA12
MDCLFCSGCQNFLNFGNVDSSSDPISLSCDICHTVNEFENAESKFIFFEQFFTEEVHLFHSEIKYDKSKRIFKADDETKATIEETCPKCGHNEMTFFTLQLRSVDEGSTVFYQCVKCAHKFNQDN